MKSGRATEDVMEMDELYNLLEGIRIEAESRIRKELSGLPGIIKAPIYNSFMPLFVNIRSEKESYHFTFQKGGAVSLDRGTHNNPDVTMSGDHTELKDLLETRDKNKFQIYERTGKIKIIAHTSKGGKGIGKIREMFE